MREHSLFEHLLSVQQEVVREEGGCGGGGGEKAGRKVGSSTYRAAEHGKSSGDVAVLKEWHMKASGGTFFSPQVSAEAEGSGLGWGLDIGSGSGDLVRSEELLRVSVRMTLPGAGTAFSVIGRITRSLRICLCLAFSTSIRLVLSEYEA